MPEVELVDRDELVEVALPEGSITGQVERSGTPVAGALVEALNVRDVFTRPYGRPSLAATETNAEGGFTLRGLVGGRWVLRARHESSSSRPQEVVLDEDGEVEELRLDLEPVSRRSFRLLSSSGVPVVGARASVATVPELPALAEPGHEVTREDGSLAVEIPPATLAVNLAVAHAGHPAWAWRLPSGGPGEVVTELRLPSRAGRLRIVLGPAARENLASLLLSNGTGGFVSLSSLVAWSAATLTPRGDLTVLDVPNLGADLWKLHRPQSMEEAVSLLQWPSSAAPIAVLDLRDGGEVTIDVP